MQLNSTQFKFYLPFIWLSSSLCALIQQKEIDASKAAFDSPNPASWGSDLTLGRRECSAGQTTSAHSSTNDVTNANLFHGRPRKGIAPEKDRLNLELTLGRNEATNPSRVEKDGTVVHDHGSKKRKMLPGTYSQSYPVKRPDVEKAKEYGFGQYQKLFTPHQTEEQMLRSIHFQKSFFTAEKEGSHQRSPQILSIMAPKYKNWITTSSHHRLGFNPNVNSAFKFSNSGVPIHISSRNINQGSDNLKPAQQTTPGMFAENWGETPNTVPRNDQGKGKVFNNFKNTNALAHGMQRYGLAQRYNQLITPLSQERPPFSINPAFTNFNRVIHPSMPRQIKYEGYGNWEPAQQMVTPGSNGNNWAERRDMVSINEKGKDQILNALKNTNSLPNGMQESRTPKLLNLIAKIENPGFS